MANPYPVELSVGGVVKESGNLTFTDAANQPGGSSAPITREQIAGNPTSIANGASVNLPWNVVSSGDALLDLTTPAAPTIVTAGTYAVSVEVDPVASMTAAGWFSVSLTLDSGGEAAAMNGTSPPASASLDMPGLSVSLTYYIPAGGTIVVRVHNGDGVSAIDFVLFGIVQRLS
jgi:hypothetical protein